MISAGPARWTMRAVQLSLLCLLVLTISFFLSGGTAFAAPPSPVLMVSPGSFTTSTFTTPGCSYASSSGWTCTAVLKRGDTLKTKVKWSATSSGISGITFSPSSGTLPAGGSTTVHIAVPNTTCPANATLSFTGPNNTVSVPWKCVAQVQSYSDSGSPGAVATGDLNGDGHPDIVTANTAFSEIAVLLNNGAGSFASPTFYAAGAGVGEGSQSIVIADFNGDGHLDIVVPGQGIAAVAVLLNNGNGTFALAIRYGSGITGDVISVAVSDVNGDGHPDIIAGVSSTATVAVLFNNGDGTFGTASSYTVGNDPGAVAVGLGHPQCLRGMGCHPLASRR
ncbi:MAG: FG-GAP repeat domain-containing protein [Ktedonobacteraceae bacterium]